jgi:hypothetical protein
MNACPSRAASAGVDKVGSLSVSRIADSPPVAPPAAGSNNSAQSSVVAPLSHVSGSHTPSPQSDSAFIASVDAPVFAVATSAIAGDHAPAVEMAAAPGDQDVNPVLKTLQQLQVIYLEFANLSSLLTPMQAMQDAGVAVDVSAGAKGCQSV